MEKWIPQFIDSLLKQDFKDFDLVIVNDGLSSEKLKIFEGLFSCKLLASNSSIAKNRNSGFSLLLGSGYRYVVFADSDDLMANNRISNCKLLLEDYEIVVNDLALINSDGVFIRDQYLSDRLGNFKKIHPYEIFDYNFVGLSNSSARVEILNDITIPDNIEAVDWYLFSTLLNRGHHAVFTSSTSTLYRQHTSNILGFHQLDEKKITFLAEQKYLHYSYLQKHSKQHRYRFVEFSKLLDKLKDPIFKKEYLKRINEQMPDNPFWFEAIKPD